MDIILKIFFFFLLSTAMGQSENDPVEGPEESSRKFHVAQHNKTRETLKSGMDGYFWKLWEMMTEANAETVLKLERHQEAVSANLSREFNENMERLLEGLSKRFDKRLEQSQTKVTEYLESLKKTLHRNHQELLSSLSNSTASLIPNRIGSGLTNPTTVGRQPELIPTIHPHVPTEVEEVSLESGTIEFTGGANSPLRRKLWVFRSKSTNSYLMVSFVMEENGLEDNARLSTWGSFLTDLSQHVWNGSQINYREERAAGGNLVLLTLSIFPSAAKTPSFKLKFETTFHSIHYILTSEVVLGGGTQVVSFPPNNTDNYPPDSWFMALIAPPHGRPVELTLKFLDIPGAPPDSCEKYFEAYFLEESPAGLPYRVLPPSVVRECGSVGAISEPIGNSTVAILRFVGSSESVGKGFRVDVKPN